MAKWKNSVATWRQKQSTESKGDRRVSRKDESAKPTKAKLKKIRVRASRSRAQLQNDDSSSSSTFRWCSYLVLKKLSDMFSTNPSESAQVLYQAGRTLTGYIYDKSFPPHIILPVLAVSQVSHLEHSPQFWSRACLPAAPVLCSTFRGNFNNC